MPMTCAGGRLWWLVALAVALVPAATAPVLAAPPAASPRATVTVEAGALDRRNTPVSFTLPAELLAATAGGRFELRETGAARRRLPLQVQDKQGHFVLPALPRGGRASFELLDAPATTPARPGSPTSPAGDGNIVNVAQQSEALVVTVDGQAVFHFRTRAPTPTAEVPARYTRAGYLHPLYSPGGVLVTDDSPADHGHHHGIWTAWTVTELAGKRMSFWGPEPGRTKNDLVSVAGLWSGPVAGGFSARLASSDLSVTPARQVLDSEWKVVVYRAEAARPGKRQPYHLFDLEWTDKVVGDKPLALPEYRYGGLGVRGNREWMDATLPTFLTSEGLDRLAGDNTRARWVHLGGPVSGGSPGKARVAGLAVLVHPSNLRAPEPVRLNPGIPEFCISPVKAGPMVIAPGRPYTARYRFVVSDGPASPPLLERLWRDYARIPKVTVVATSSKS